MEFALFDPVTGETKEVDYKVLKGLVSYTKFDVLKKTEGGNTFFANKMKCYVARSEFLTANIKKKLMNEYLIHDETWIELHDEYEKYKVSDYGRVKGKKGKILLPKLTRKGRGYAVTVGIRKKNKGFNTPVKVKTLVDLGFHIRGEGKCITNVDINKWNNKVSNLKRTSFSSVTTKRNKRYTKPVAMLDKKTNEVLDVFESCTEAANDVYGQKCNIAGACNGRLKTSYGYKWRYATFEEYEGF